MSEYSPVAIAACSSYDNNEVREALQRATGLVDGLSFVKPGMRIAIKVNLVAGGTPESAVTTHPVVAAELCRMIRELGATPVVGDSPGGVFTDKYVSGVYRHAKMELTEEAGGILNHDFGAEHRENPEGKVAKVLDCTSWIFQCDALINVCKLKTHGMMSYSGAVKNLFGTVPGTMKPEYHFRFPNIEDFADMLVDIDEFYKPALNIMDAVVGMEGNGPTAGTPRKVGCILASASPYPLDLAAAGIIGLSAPDVPTIAAAVNRGLSPKELSELTLLGDPVSRFTVSDYELIRERSSLAFTGKLKGPLGKFMGTLFSKALESRPVPEKNCVGCEECRKICPAKAIHMENKRPVIDRSKCIKCFCCQEFCPVGAMKVHRTLPARLLQGIR